LKKKHGAAFFIRQCRALITAQSWLVNHSAVTPLKIMMALPFKQSFSLRYFIILQFFFFEFFS